MTVHRSFMSALPTEFIRRDSSNSRASRSDLSASPVVAPSPAELHAIIDQVKKLRFSPFLTEWIEAYEKVGQRGRFLWQWCLRGVDLITLPSVKEELRCHVVETKLLSIFYGTLIDDIADRDQDGEMLQLAVSLGFEEWSRERLTFWAGRRREYLEMVARIWKEVWSRCSSYPRFKEFEQILRFDTEQTLNAMRYALMVNQRPEGLNVIEHDLYQPHNMQIMFMASVDLCASPTFDMDELGAVREIFWHAQRMGRIGNMITTWEREVLDRDFSSGIFAHAIHLGVLKGTDLRDLPAHEIMSRLEESSCQEVFIQEWKYHRDLMAKKIKTILSVDLSGYLSGFEEVLKLHLGSRGLL